jgi:O-antigen ligase
VVLPTGASAEITPVLNVGLGGTTVHIADLLYLAWFAIVLAWVAVSLRSTRFSSSQTIALALVCWATVGLAFGLMRSFSVTAVMRDYRGFFFYAAVIPAAFEIRSRRYAESLVAHFMLAISAYAVLILALALLPTGFPLVRETITYWYGERRLHFQNTFYLPLGIGMAFAVAVLGRGAWRLGGALATPLLVAALILSQTRSAFAAAVSAIALVPFLIPWRKRPLRPSEFLVLFASGILLTIGLATLVLHPQVLPARLAEGLQSPTRIPSLLGRASTFATALDLWRTHPLVGWGLGKGVDIPWATISYKPWLSSMGQSGQLPAVDNSLLTAGFKLGAVGVVLLVAVWWLVGRDSVISARPTAKDSGRSNNLILRMGLLASLPGYLAISMLQTTLVTYRSVVVWMILARALAIIAERLERGSAGSANRTGSPRPRPQN